MTGFGHYRRGGPPKISYSSVAEAWAAARVLFGDTHTVTRPYLCRDRRYPPHWHIGRRPVRAVARAAHVPRHADLLLELGERAAGCLIVENHALPRKVAVQLRRRFLAAAERRDAA